MFSDEDAENALAHAIGAIDDLSVNPDNEDYKERLKNDILNYLECVRSSKERRNAYHLLRVGADILILKDIAKIIQDQIERTEMQVLEDGPINIEQALDFRSLYIELGDRALFVERDYETAIVFYRYAGYEWPVEEEYVNPRKHDQNERYSGLSEDEMYEWQDKADLFQKIMLGQTELDYSCLRIDDRKDDYQSLFQNIAESALAYSHELIPRTNILIERIGTSVEEANDTSRLGQFLIESVRKNYGVHVLYFLSKESEETIKEYSDDILSVALLTKGSRYRALREWIRDASYEKFHKAIVTLKNIEAVYYSDQILSQLKVAEGEADESGYYTRFDTLELMLPDKCDERKKTDECGMLSVMDVAYMNDPNEGMVLRKYLYSGKSITKASVRQV